MLYLRLTRTEQALEELPNFTIKLTSINTSEDYSRMELLQIKQETLTKQIENLAKLGIDINANDGYTKTRKQLLTEFFGSILTEAILEDEKALPVLKPQEGTEGSDTDIGGSSGMSNFDTPSGGGLPAENETDDLAPANNTELEPADGIDSNDIQPPEDTNYELQ